MNLQAGRHKHNRFCCMLVVVRSVQSDCIKIVSRIILVYYCKLIIIRLMNNHETTLYLMHVIYCGLAICTLSDLY